MDGYFIWCTTGIYSGTYFVLGHNMFNIFLCDMFLFCKDRDFASYADDNTPYCIGKTPEEVIRQRNLQYPFLNGFKMTE